jgi:uncharacterized metal-binding protein YceD (DUF177 family)
LKLVNQYIIPFSGLKEGDHKFTFGFNRAFFEKYSALEARDGEIEAVVWLEKKPSMLNLDINLKGKLEIQCDRCLDYFDMPLHYEGHIVVKFSDDVRTGTDEIWILPPNSFELDMEQYFYECIGLCIPIQRIHPENENQTSACNQEMMKLLESHRNTHKENENIDPRWIKLKELLNNTNNNT